MTEPISVIAAVERKGQQDRPPIAGGLVAVTPPIDEDYWTYRIVLSEHQALVGFPKFGGIGIGFAQEVNWNTNKPWPADAGQILVWICVNKGDESIPDGLVYDAIKKMQAAIAEDLGTTLEAEQQQAANSHPEIAERLRSLGMDPFEELTREQALARCVERRREFALDLLRDDDVHPAAPCILTGAPGEDPDDCTTHRHEAEDAGTGTTP